MYCHVGELPVRFGPAITREQLAVDSATSALMRMAIRAIPLRRPARAKHCPSHSSADANNGITLCSGASHGLVRIP